MLNKATIGEGLVKKLWENGSVISPKNLPISEPDVTLWSKILECGKEGFAWLAENGWEIISTGSITIAKFLMENNEIFIIIGIVGMFIVMMGRGDLGKKITSGTIFAYLISKGLSAIA